MQNIDKFFSIYYNNLKNFIELHVLQISEKTNIWKNIKYVCRHSITPQKMTFLMSNHNMT